GDFVNYTGRRPVGHRVEGFPGVEGTDSNKIGPVLWQMMITSSCKSLSEADEGRDDESLFELFSEVVFAFFSSLNVLMTRIQQAISGSPGATPQLKVDSYDGLIRGRIDHVRTCPRYRIKKVFAVVKIPEEKDCGSRATFMAVGRLYGLPLAIKNASLDVRALAKQEDSPGTVEEGWELLPVDVVVTCSAQLRILELLVELRQQNREVQ
ncbi:hypothetical protein HPB47_027137, partial [Ixodes persulcatus]